MSFSKITTLQIHIVSIDSNKDRKTYFKVVSLRHLIEHMFQGQAMEEIAQPPSGQTILQLIRDKFF